MQMLEKIWNKNPIKRIIIKTNTINSKIDKTDNIIHNNIDDMKNIDEIYQYVNSLDNSLIKNSKIHLYDGNINSKYCIIHEYYSRNNINTDKQFVNKILEKHAYNMNDVCQIYLIPINIDKDTNILEKDMKIFRNITYKLIDILNPKYILSLGSNVAQNLFINEKINITNIRGTIKDININHKKIPVLITFHPISVLKNKEYLKLFTQDIQNNILIS